MIQIINLPNHLHSSKKAVILRSLVVVILCLHRFFPYHLAQFRKQSIEL